ncbi:disheveled-associated activator of morphogenesis 1 [Tachysurus ichikawai]
MAPNKQSSRGWASILCCFQRSEQPEITYRVGHDTNLTLHTLEPRLPIPPAEELDAMFSELVVCVHLLSCQNLKVCSFLL